MCCFLGRSSLVEVNKERVNKNKENSDKKEIIHYWNEKHIVKYNIKVTIVWKLRIENISVPKGDIGESKHPLKFEFGKAFPPFSPFNKTTPRQNATCRKKIFCKYQIFYFGLISFSDVPETYPLNFLSCSLISTYSHISVLLSLSFYFSFPLPFSPPPLSIKTFSTWRGSPLVP